MRPVYGAAGSVVAVVDSSGGVTLGDGPGPVVGAVRGNEIFDDEAGARLAGHVDSSGRVYDASHEIIGFVDASMLVADKHASRVGRVFEPVDAGVLLLLVGTAEREAPRIAPLDDESAPTVMDEVFDAEWNAKRPGIREAREAF